MKLKILSCFLVLLNLSVFSQKTENYRLSPEEFAIMPWGSTTGELSVLKDIYECGFNLAGFVDIGDLQNVSLAGLKAIVYDEAIRVCDPGSKYSPNEINDKINYIARKTADNPAVYAYYLIDEPGASVFEELKKWKDKWTELAPEKYSYINLFPVYADKNQHLQEKSYDDYLEKYVEIVQPDFISYDNYSLMSNGTLRKGYFENLEKVRAISIKNNIPFWNIVLSNSHFDYMEPTYQGLCFQLYTSLAYGARGISYFTYFAPKTGNYRSAPIDQFGNKTATWNILQNVNLQLHAIGQIYIKLKSVNVFHHPAISESKNGLAGSNFLNSLKGNELLVGEFIDDNQTPYVMVVNKSLTKSTNIYLSFRKKGPIYQINNYTGKAEIWSGENTWLAPGQGRILFIKEE